MTDKNKAAPMNPVIKPYPGQFSTAPDLLHVAIPRIEIIAEMALRGEHETLDDICLAVALVADAIGSAQVNA
ncbi:MAG: hypothetical protein O7F71_00230 [Gammaproteobacteria bacterium]|nr:hypothetical protein [Gammaproteobacteria bacterium]